MGNSSRQPPSRQPQPRGPLSALLARVAPVLRWLPAAAYMVANWVVSDTPGERLGPLPAPDWLLHGLAYFVFGVTLYVAVGGGVRRGLASAAISAAYAAIDEWHQSWVPGRSAALSDWVADVVGAGLGWLAASWLQGARLQRRRFAEPLRSRRVSVRLLALLALAASALAAALGAAVPRPVGPVADAGHDAPAGQALVQLHTLLDEAERALQSGDLAGAREQLARAAAGGAPQGYAAFRFLTLQTRAALAAGDAGEAVALARAALETAVEDDRLDARLLLAEALEAAGQHEAAFDALADVADDSELLYRGLLRHQVLDRLAALAGRLDPESPEARARLLRFGRTLYRFGRWQEGVALFSRPGWQEHRLQALSELARGLGASGQRVRQVSVLREALDDAESVAAPTSHVSSLRLQLAAAMQQAGLAPQAEALLEAVLREDAGSPAAGEALASLVRAALDAGDVGQALAWVERYGTAAVGTNGWKEALWSLFAAACDDAACEEADAPGPEGTRQDGQAAGVSVARRALEMLEQGGARDAGYLYWQARLDPGRRAALVTELLRTQPLSYYALLARRRWPDLAAGPAAAFAPAPPPAGGPELDLSAIVALREAGRPREAMLELRYLLAPAGRTPSAGPGRQPPRESLATLARWEMELGEVRAALRHLAPLAQPSGSDGPVLDAEGRWVLQGLFPLPYEEVVRAEAAARGLDPLLIWAVMREESSFEPDALSPSDAHGLMQLLPSTARWVADRIGARWAAPSDLFDPALNIRLGAAYLRYLLDRFDDVRLAVAAYHAGPGRVERWAAVLSSADPELRVERIPVAATRRYVQNVYRSYLIYRELYGEGLAPHGAAPALRTSQG